jgi:hypothetical protein
VTLFFNKSFSPTSRQMAHRTTVNKSPKNNKKEMARKRPDTATATTNRKVVMEKDYSRGFFSYERGGGVPCQTFSVIYFKWTDGAIKDGKSLPLFYIDSVLCTSCTLRVENKRVLKPF